jgi:hypothetical protein
MERLVVLRPELADLSRKFSSSFVLRDLVDAGEAVGQLLAPWRFESAQSQFCSCAGGMHQYSFWRDVRAVYPPSRAFPHSPSRPHRIIVSVLGSREIAAAPKSDFNPQEKMDVPN